MVGIITTPEAEIEQKREVKLTNGSGAPTQGTTAGGFSEVVAQFIVPSEQRSGVGVNVPVQPVVDVRPPWGNGRVVWYRDATANDSDKSFTVPAGKVWDVKSVKTTLVATATVGNRTMTNIITDGTNEVYRAHGITVAASQTGITIIVGGDSFYYAATALFSANSGLQFCAGSLLLPAGYVIRTYDAAAVDAAADDMTVVLHYVEYDA